MSRPEYGDRRRRPVVGGAASRNRRGGFGRSMWGRAFVEAVERVAEDPGRLARGRTYARAGQVVSYRVEPGAVVAEVQGSQPRPFASVCRVRKLREEEVELLIDTIRAEPGMLARIVSGTLPTALAEHLLPDTAADLDFGCSCPDHGWPCKHVAAVCYLLAEDLDERPRELLTLRGVSMETLIGGVERADPTDTTDPYGDGTELPALPTPETRPALDDLDPTLLRRALRMMSEDEATAAAGLRGLTVVYTDLTAR
ncbi:SWIM zinc finger family protein [Nocardia brevicatena]|uniref:SWIM zinc finger family protein n=1 Tax=Nocardia brevicatena TaxID=37327 RepID=UPI0002F70D9E|nr:SWIM zinc finger family protein [Nocardia brevicatena]